MKGKYVILLLIAIISCKEVSHESKIEGKTDLLTSIYTKLSSNNNSGKDIRVVFPSLFNHADSLWLVLTINDSMPHRLTYPGLNDAGTIVNGSTGVFYFSRKKLIGHELLWGNKKRIEIFDSEDSIWSYTFVKDSLVSYEIRIDSALYAHAKVTSYMKMAFCMIHFKNIRYKKEFFDNSYPFALMISKDIPLYKDSFDVSQVIDTLKARTPLYFLSVNVCYNPLDQPDIWIHVSTSIEKGWIHYIEKDEVVTYGDESGQIGM